MAIKGPEYVEAALAKIEGISTGIGGLAGLKETWKTEAQERLAAISEMLKATTDRFFLKTRVCLPFARKCDQAAGALEDLVAEQSAQDKLETALTALEKAARTLDERSMMQGMAIT